MRISTKDGRYMRGNKGFSIIELIVVIAIMAVLVGVIAPWYVRYVEKTKRTLDAQNAEAIVESMDRMATLYNAHSYSTSAGDWVMEYYNRKAGTSISDDSVYSKAFTELGGIPDSRVDDDLWWAVYYYEPGSAPEGATVDPGKKPAKKVYLVHASDHTKGYELYPDATKYIEDFEMVSITLD